MKYRPRLLTALAVALFWALLPNAAKATTNYGTAAATAALQFNPFSGATQTVSEEAFLRSTQPILVPRAASVAAPALADDPSTPVKPPTPVLSVVDSAPVFEGPYLKGLKAVFVVTIKPSVNKTVTVKYKTANGTARAGIEYAAKTGTLTFAPKQLTQMVQVDILNDDLKVKSNGPGPRRFYLDIFSPTNAKLGRTRGSADIAENGKPNVTGIVVSNALPVFEVGSTVKAMFTVALNHASTKVVKINYNTQNGTATAGQDYKSVTGLLTFEPGQTMKTVSVQIYDNKSTTTESLVEGFSLVLSHPSNCEILRKQGFARILEFKN